MKTILKPHHFVGELTIGQAVSEFAFTNDLQWYIDKYEPVFFRALCGIDLYQQMLFGMTPEPEETDEPPETEEESGGESEPVEPNEWDRLAEVVLPYLTMFVWYKYNIDNHTHPAGLGEVSQRFESAEKKSNQVKMVRVWNELIDHFVGLAQWIVDREEEYPDFDPDVQLAIYHRLVVEETERENLYGI